MTRRSVEAEIARIDALSRTRALNDAESRQLEKLLTVQRRYDSYGRRPKRAIPERQPCTATIHQRLQSTLIAMVREGLSHVRAIYLNPADRAEANAAGIIEPDAGVARFSGIEIRAAREGKRSVVYTNRGIARSIRIRP